MGTSRRVQGGGGRANGRGVSQVFVSSAGNSTKLTDAHSEQGLSTGWRLKLFDFARGMRGFLCKDYCRDSDAWTTSQHSIIVPQSSPGSRKGLLIGKQSMRCEENLPHHSSMKDCCREAKVGSITASSRAPTIESNRVSCGVC